METITDKQTRYDILMTIGAEDNYYRHLQEANERAIKIIHDQIEKNLKEERINFDETFQNCCSLFGAKNSYKQFCEKAKELVTEKIKSYGSEILSWDGNTTILREKSRGICIEIYKSLFLFVKVNILKSYK